MGLLYISINQTLFYASPCNTSLVKYIRQRISATLQLSVEKAAAHLKNPGQYPLPSGRDNLEFAIVDLLKTLPKRKPDRFLDKMKEALNAGTAARQQRYGDLAAIDLRNNKVIADQAKTIEVLVAMRITEADLPQLKIPGLNKKKVKAVKPVAGGRQPSQAVPGTQLLFAVESITCNKPTDIRKDEVSLSAFAISSSGEQQERNNFFSADFKKKERKSPGAAGNLFRFDIGDSTGSGFPISFSAGVFIVEKDWIRNAETAEKVGAILRLTGKLICFGSLSLLFIPAASLPLSLSVLGIGAVILFTGDVLLFFAGDDTSETGTDDLLLETPPLAGENFARNITLQFVDDGFIKSGNYSVAVRWTVE